MVWSSIRSGIKAVVDFRSQNFAIFSEIYGWEYAEIAKSGDLKSATAFIPLRIDHQTHIPPKRAGKEFLKTCFIPANIGRGKN